MRNGRASRRNIATRYIAKKYCDLDRMNLLCDCRTRLILLMLLLLLDELYEVLTNTNSRRVLGNENADVGKLMDFAADRFDSM